MQVIPLKTVGVVAFIMVFSYFSAYMVFGDESSVAGMQDRYALSTPVNFTIFLDACYNVVRDWLQDDNHWNNQQLITGGYFYKPLENKAWQDLLKNIGYNVGTTFYLRAYNWNIEGLYGGEWWWKWRHNNDVTGSKVYREQLTDRGRVFMDEQVYNTYLHSFDLQTKEGFHEGDWEPQEKNFWDKGIEFFSKIPNGFQKLMDVLTFSFKNQYGEHLIPSGVRFWLLIFFIPLWIILTIGILPIITDIIKAIGEFIPF